MSNGDNCIQKMVVDDTLKIGNRAGLHVCQYCGSDLTLLASECYYDIRLDQIVEGEEIHQVLCPNCDMCGPVGHTEEEAIAKYYNQPYGIPKLYSAEEVMRDSSKVLVCWLEERSDAEKDFGFAYPAHMTKHPHFGDIALTNAIFAPVDNLLEFKAAGGTYLKELYGKTWRCWTSRPSDVCRVQVKWEI